MEINLNITFPHIPCILLTLDVMEKSGSQQDTNMNNISKVRLTSASQGAHVIAVEASEP